MAIRPALLHYGTAVFAYNDANILARNIQRPKGATG